VAVEDQAEEPSADLAAAHPAVEGPAVGGS